MRVYIYKYINELLPCGSGCYFYTISPQFCARVARLQMDCCTARLTTKHRKGQALAMTGKVLATPRANGRCKRPPSWPILFLVKLPLSTITVRLQRNRARSPPFVYRSNRRQRGRLSFLPLANKSGRCIHIRMCPEIYKAESSKIRRATAIIVGDDQSS